MNPLHQITGPIAERKIARNKATIGVPDCDQRMMLEADADVATLLALMPWVGHKDGCPKLINPEPYIVKTECTCGLDATLQKLGAKV